ncbi:MAG: IS66 family insertion sequence element accessory protein TnpB [Bacteroidia bacterium]|nr:IS66 family insertion sequence element accessory protein TnpB [Bacteroidia bacterium]
MMVLSASHRYFLYRPAVDMRKGFDGLSGLVISKMGQDVLSGDVFIFMNRRRDKIKLLVWDRTGFVLYYKRLESGSFELPPGPDTLGLPWDMLVMLLEGVSLGGLQRRKRYVRAAVG